MCDDCGEVFSTRQGVGTHRSRTHGIPSATAQRLALRGSVGDHQCPECSLLYTSPQGLAAHRRATHGYSAKAAAAAKAAAKPVRKKATS